MLFRAYLRTSHTRTLPIFPSSQIPSTNFIPVKAYDTGDGFFFQWVMCAAIWTVGLFVQFYVGSTEFVPLAALGGVSWATGNITVVPILSCIGREWASIKTCHTGSWMLQLASCSPSVSQWRKAC